MGLLGILGASMALTMAGIIAATVIVEQQADQNQILTEENQFQSDGNTFQQETRGVIRRADETAVPYPTVCYVSDELMIGGAPQGGKTRGWGIPDSYIRGAARTLLLPWSKHGGAGVDISVQGNEQALDIIPVYSTLTGTVVEMKVSDKPQYGQFNRARNARYVCVNGEDLWEVKPDETKCGIAGDANPGGYDGGSGWFGFPAGDAINTWGPPWHYSGNPAAFGTGPAPVGIPAGDTPIEPGFDDTENPPNENYLQLLAAGSAGSGDLGEATGINAATGTSPGQTAEDEATQQASVPPVPGGFGPGGMIPLGLRISYQNESSPNTYKRYRCQICNQYEQGSRFGMNPDHTYRGSKELLPDDKYPEGEFKGWEPDPQAGDCGCAYQVWKCVNRRYECTRTNDEGECVEEVCVECLSWKNAGEACGRLDLRDFNSMCGRRYVLKLRPPDYIGPYAESECAPGSGRRACMHGTSARNFDNLWLPELRFGKVGNWEIVQANLTDGTEQISLDSTVQQDSQVGTMGNSGEGTNAPLLHYEVRKYTECGTLQDPNGCWEARNPEEFIDEISSDSGGEGIPPPCCPGGPTPPSPPVCGPASRTLCCGGGCVYFNNKEDLPGYGGEGQEHDRVRQVDPGSWAVPILATADSGYDLSDWGETVSVNAPPGCSVASVGHGTNGENPLVPTGNGTWACPSGIKCHNGSNFVGDRGLTVDYRINLVDNVTGGACTSSVAPQLNLVSLMGAGNGNPCGGYQAVPGSGGSGGTDVSGENSPAAQEEGELIDCEAAMEQYEIELAEWEALNATFQTNLCQQYEFPWLDQTTDLECNGGLPPCPTAAVLPAVEVSSCGSYGINSSTAADGTQILSVHAKGGDVLADWNVTVTCGGTPIWNCFAPGTPLFNGDDWQFSSGMSPDICFGKDNRGEPGDVPECPVGSTLGLIIKPTGAQECEAQADDGAFNNYLNSVSPAKAQLALQELNEALQTWPSCEGL